MALVRYDLSPVRDRYTGETRTELVGQQVLVVLRDTTTPAQIFEDAAGTIPIANSRRTVLPTFAIPTIYHDPAQGLIDWLDEPSGARGPITSEQGYVDYAQDAAASAADSAGDSAEARDAAQATSDEVATLRRWIELGVTRRNYCVNPRAVGVIAGGAIAGFGTYGPGTGETGTTTIVTDATDGPVLPDGTRATTYARRHVDAPKTAGSTGWQGRGPSVRAPMAGVAGDPVSVAVYMRYTGPGATVTLEPRLRIMTYDQLGSGAIETNLGDTALGAIKLPPGQWVRSGNVRPATADFQAVGWWAYLAGATVANQVNEANTDLDCVCVLVTDAGEVPLHFDGDTQPSDALAARWSGEANASVSELLDMGVIGRAATQAAETAAAAAQEAATAAAQRGLPAGGLPGQVPVKTGPNDYAAGWGNVVRLAGDQPLRLWGVASSLPPAGSGQQPGDVIFLIGGGA